MGQRKPDMPGEAPFEERINEAILAYKTAVTIYNGHGRAPHHAANNIHTTLKG